MESLLRIERKYDFSKDDFSPREFTCAVTEILILLSDPDLTPIELSEVLVYVSQLVEVSSWFLTLHEHTVGIVVKRGSVSISETDISTDDTQEHVFSPTEWEEIQKNGYRLDETQPVFPPTKSFLENTEN